MGYRIFDRLCKAKGVTAYQVAKETGVSTSTLSSWKTGRYTPKDDKLQKLADYFNVTVSYLRSDELTEEKQERYAKIAESINANVEHRIALGITAEEWELISAFRYLNEDGMEKAISDIVDLTCIQKYRKPEYNDGYIRF